MLYTDKNIDFVDSEFKCEKECYGGIHNDASPIFKKFYLYESLKSKSISKNIELKKFLGCEEIEDGSTDATGYTCFFGIIAFIVFMGLLGFSQIILEGAPFFICILIFVTVLAYYLGIKIILKKIFDKVYLSIKTDLFERLLKKVEIKGLLEDYNKILISSDISVDNKEIVQKIFDVLNNTLFFNFLFSDYTICKKHIKLLLNKDDILSLVTGRYILETLEFNSLNNSIEVISDYFDYIEEVKDKISLFNYNEMKSLYYIWNNLDETAIFLAKGYKIFNTSQLYDAINLGFEIDKFLCDNLTDDKVEYFNKKVKWFIDTYVKEQFSLLDKLYNIERPEMRYIQ